MAAPALTRSAPFQLPSHTARAMPEKVMRYERQRSDERSVPIPPGSLAGSPGSSPGTAPAAWLEARGAWRCRVSAGGLIVPELVADAADREDVFALLAKFLPDGPHVDIDVALIDVRVSLDLLEQQVAGEDPAGSRGQRRQQLELGQGQRDVLFLASDLELRLVDDQVIELEPLSRRPLVLERAATQDRLDAGQELLDLERLDDVVVGADAQPEDHVSLLALGGQHDDGHLPGLRVAAQPLRHLQAIEARQHEVEDGRRWPP